LTINKITFNSDTKNNQIFPHFQLTDPIILNTLLIIDRKEFEIPYIQGDIEIILEVKADDEALIQFQFFPDGDETKEPLKTGSHDYSGKGLAK